VYVPLSISLNSPARTQTRQHCALTTLVCLAAAVFSLPSTAVAQYTVTVTVTPAIARGIRSGDIPLAIVLRSPELVNGGQNEFLTSDGWVSGSQIRGDVFGTATPTGFDYGLGGFLKNPECQQDHRILVVVCSRCGLQHVVVNTDSTIHVAGVPWHLGDSSSRADCSSNCGGIPCRRLNRSSHVDALQDSGREMNAVDLSTVESAFNDITRLCCKSMPSPDANAANDANAAKDADAGFGPKRRSRPPRRAVNKPGRTW